MGERKRRGLKKLFEEIVNKNFPNLAREADTQVDETQRVTNKVNLKRHIPRHVITKMSKLKGKSFLKQQEKNK